MVIINTWDDYRNIPVTEYLDDHTTWDIYCQNWVPLLPMILVIMMMY
jgi:hypothetical protein